MRKILILVFSIIIPSYAYAHFYTDEQIKRILIEESISSYEGSCPCPYSLDLSGIPCKNRSTHVQTGEALCYPSEITQEMISQYRNEHLNFSHAYESFITKQPELSKCGEHIRSQYHRLRVSHIYGEHTLQSIIHESQGNNCNANDMYEKMLYNNVPQKMMP